MTHDDDGITTIASASEAHAELAKVLPGVPVFARQVPHRFGCEVGYKMHNGHGVELVVLGRGTTWANALNNAEVRISRGSWRPRRPIVRRARPREGRPHGIAGDLFDGGGE